MSDEPEGKLRPADEEPLDSPPVGSTVVPHDEDTVPVRDGGEEDDEGGLGDDDEEENEDDASG